MHLQKSHILINILNVFFFSVLFCLISLVNHYHFRTNWFDLGFYTNHLYQYAHFNFSHFSVSLSDHFDLLLVVFSPLVYILGSYTLLIIQIFFILLGGIGVYRFCILQSLKSKHAILFQIIFYLFFGVYGALAFDYHSNVIAACLIPFLFLYYQKGKKWKFLLVYLLIFISKENMILWLAFILLALPFTFKNQTQFKTGALVLSAFSFFSFYFITSVVMPSLINAQEYPNFKYEHIGNSHNFKDVFIFLISHPLEGLNLFFSNYTGISNYNNVKTESLVFIFLSGGFLLFIRPLYFFMLIPAFAQKYLHDSPEMWGVNFQYNIEFAPIIILCAIDVVKSIQNAKTLNILIYCLLILNLGLTIHLMDNTICYIKRSSIRFYQMTHYEGEFDVKKMNWLFSKIPNESSVSAQSMFTPHLALRKNIKLYKGHEDTTDYILVAQTDEPYPLEKEVAEKELQLLFKSKTYQLVSAIDHVYLFKKKSSQN